MNSVPIGGERLTGALEQLFTETVQVLQKTDSLSAIREVQQTWTIRDGMGEVPAFIGPVDVGLRVRPQETRMDAVTQIRQQRRVILKGHFPEMDHTDRLRWDGHDWNIVSLIHDSFDTITMLLIEQVIPGNV